MANALRALFFDVFGTLVDWRSGIAREARAVLAPLGYELDWLAFADAWRGEYQPALEAVRQGRAPFRKLDELHRDNLERILPRFGIPSLMEESMLALNKGWHRLDAWPDSAPGLARLGRQYVIAPVSNGNISLMVALARRNGFAWHAILGAELARDYKPKPHVYQSAAAALDLPVEQCAMVAAHADDLTAARRCGLRTAFIARPDEHGPGKGATPPREPVDWIAGSIEDLAQQLVAGTTAQSGATRVP
jgi:2-haloacid dehalogenase